MTYLDAGELTPDEMHGRAPIAVASVTGPCRECHYEDGTLDTETMDMEGVCTFGCGRKVDDDMKVCPACQDRSANEYECPGCNTTYAKWGNTWEKQS